MKLTPQEKQEIIEAIKTRYKKKIEDATFERIVFDNQERIDKHAAEISAEIINELRTMFPL